MKRRNFGLGFVFLLLPSLLLAASNGLPASTPEAVGLSSARLERLAQAIKQDIERERMPGAVVAIARKGKLAYYEAFGFVDKTAGAPMPKDAIFALASMTKPMVAVGTLMLAEQGDLLLNDPVGNYLPDLKDMKVAGARGLEPAHRQPTLQDMLRHTAGVSYGNRGDTPLHKLYELRLKSAANQSGPEFLAELGKLPLHYQPGTQWEYSHVQAVAVLPLGARLIVQRQLAKLREKFGARLVRRALQPEFIQLVQRRVAAIAVAHARRMAQHVLQCRLAMRGFDAPRAGHLHVLQLG